MFIGTLGILILSCTSAPQYLAFEEEDDFYSSFPLSKERYEKENVNGSFPESISIKTRTQSFNSLHYYVVKDGLIWYKGLTRATGPSHWTLLMQTGLPHNTKRDDFYEPRKIVEISADGHELVALSDEGWFYRLVFDDESSKSKKNSWNDTLGWPTPSPLKLNEVIANNRGWAISKRDENVRYYEDIFGNQHHYGTAGVMTNYVLLADGQEIRFADPGLPSDFSRTLIGPERGAFIAENIAASASTIFLIGASGEMYTRLADFDTIGSDPMFFKYTYVPYKSKIPGTKYKSILEPWGLPGEGWRSQPPIPLSGKAVISKHISIVQNGRGNAARELRVAGRDSEGVAGYWSKPIFGDTWTFVRSPLTIPESDVLHVEKYVEGKGPRGPIADKRFGGHLWKNEEAIGDIYFEIPDFNILEGSCTLVIFRGAERVSLVLHPVEAWTYIKRVSPGRDGTPKLYMATLEIPEGSFAGISDQFREFLDRYILSDNRELFAYFVEATTDYILIEPRNRSKAGYALYLTPSGEGVYHPDTFRAKQVAEIAKYDRYATQELMMKNEGPFVRADLEGLKTKLAANKKLAADMSARIKAFSVSQRNAAMSRFAYSTLNLVSHATLLYRNRYVYTITRHSGALLSFNGDQFDLIAGTQVWLDSLRLDLVNTRIKAYSEVIRTLEGGAQTAILPPGYAETYQDYLAAEGIPETLEGRLLTSSLPSQSPEPVNVASLPTKLCPVPVEKDFPGWLMEVGKEPAFSLLVELEGTARKLYARAGLPASKKKLTLRARIYLVSTGSDERDRDLYRQIVKSDTTDSGIPAVVTWDGSLLTIKWVTIASTEILFRGLLPSRHP